MGSPETYGLLRDNCTELTGLKTAEKMYIELDHALVPRKRENIHSREELPGRVSKEDEWTGYNKMRKYPLKYGNTQDIFLEFERGKLDKKAESDAHLNELLRRWNLGDREIKSENDKNVDVSNCEPVIGPSENVVYDKDFGFFSAILACYNNHWILKTSPDDWWNVITRTVAQAVDDNGDEEKVRNFFVEHDGKKKIRIEVPKLSTVNYSWLFDQFSEGIRANIKTPEYVDLMQANFSTTTLDRMISSQVMIMSSMQKYFSFHCGTSCGIPGVEMQGTREDWEQLLNKTEQLECLLERNLAG